jgi:hypothetical protein
MKDGMVCWLCENAPELALGYVPGHAQQGSPAVSVERHLPPQPAPAPAPVPTLPPPPVGDFFHLFDREWNAEDNDAFWEIRS